MTARLLQKWAPLLAVAAGLSPFARAAQETVLDLDPGQTKVEYTLGTLLHTVEGTFTFMRGSIRFDPESGKASGELVVDATSGSSGNSGRDGRMHSKIIESMRFPEIVFHPDRVKGQVAPQGTSHVEMHGVISLHGGDHELTMPVDVDAASGQYKAVAKFQVPYIMWGLKNPSTLFLRVNDKVDITIHAVARARATAQAAFIP